MLRAIRTPAIMARLSFSVRRKLKWILGGASGSDDLSRTVPRPSGLRCTGLIDKGFCVANGDMDPWVRILAAAFQQQDAVAAGLGQARSEHTACRAGTGDDEVIGALAVSHVCSSPERLAATLELLARNVPMAHGSRNCCHACR
jgi:hypothetical protein